MDWILSSKLFKGSSRQAKILAEVNNPLNQPLLKQLSQYIDPKYLESPESKEEDEKLEDFSEVNDVDTSKDTESSKESEATKNAVPKASPSTLSKRSSNSKMEFTPKEDESKEADASEDTAKSNQDAGEATESDETEVSSSIHASTYITIQDISEVLTTLPGTLNLREETCGALYAALKSSNSNELWIYYKDDVDISKILDKIIDVINLSNYYFLDFNRVDRNSNAAIFTVTWVSNYFHPSQLNEVHNE